MSMAEVYKKIRRGETFKTISDLDFARLNIKNPAELAANSPVMQQVIAKQWNRIQMTGSKEANKTRQ
ncbi:hypothetical protein [Paenibacillus apiarius]|uniref:Uncharacterized protein n=1 Tax=Paenibacillus apiarius TaxID=46240 RepID=A0ABT4DWI4_9BACL|nr:hypothetical protein [Paenibacillus apiarius]MCY9516876.1 hypothetical protein [Paenibacillus apiarius]MCY9521722.1 hypothetical protein [Paenibacillus apiarius]MCY9551597.1 hypothetical protein [Paenibacillus apiarius]MCY9558752.1 hypothetical protein [Paenibacillus apiarius]MCY9683934.1 hypothetical protein [Paenibacillus apiarius]